MTAPNIVSVVTITGKTNAITGIGTSSAELVANATSSNNVLKVNAVILGNVYGNDTTATVELRRGGVDYSLVQAIDVPNKSTLDVLNKPLYLEEGDSLRVTAGHAAALEAICSYELLTDQ